MPRKPATPGPGTEPGKTPNDWVSELVPPFVAVNENGEENRCVAGVTGARSIRPLYRAGEPAAGNPTVVSEAVPSKLASAIVIEDEPNISELGSTGSTGASTLRVKVW